MKLNDHPKKFHSRQSFFGQKEKTAWKRIESVTVSGSFHFTIIFFFSFSFNVLILCFSDSLCLRSYEGKYIKWRIFVVKIRLKLPGNCGFKPKLKTWPLHFFHDFPHQTLGGFPTKNYFLNVVNGLFLFYFYPNDEVKYFPKSTLTLVGWSTFLFGVIFQP